MNDVFHVLRYESPPDAKCLIEVDEYVPLRFRTYERPLGASYLRVGDLAGSLVELLVDPTTGLLRGVTVTSFPALSAWPIVAARDASQGLPVFAVSWGRMNRIDAGVDFSVSVSGTEVLVYWQALDRCEASSFQGRVRFLSVDGHLAGVHFAGLSPNEVKTFARCVKPA